MSLTRDEWVEMWHAIIAIEKVLLTFAWPTSSVLIKVKFIKTKIQDVIGQME